jgi:signal transduction histidine kinase
LHSKTFEAPFREALRKISDDPRFKSLVDIELKMDLPRSESLTPIRSEHVLAIVNEALSNIIRHSRAKNVTLSAQKINHDLRLTIEDDGIGIPEIVESGYGLRNMRDRARLLGGELVITPKNGKGTIVTLEIPWSDER